MLGVSLFIKQYDLLNRVELMDYLDSIDCSLEDFQAMLYGKQFSTDTSVLEVCVCDGEHEQLSAQPSLMFHFC